MRSAARTAAGIIENPQSSSVKRLAWAFGCAKRDSDEEIALYRILVDRVRALKVDR